MNKRFVCLALAVGLISQPAFVISAGAASSSSVSVPTGYELMQNGDISQNGIGSVTDELEQYGYSLSSFTSGNTQGILMAESGADLYFYAYCPSASLSFDRISMAYNGTDTGSIELSAITNFFSYSMSLASYTQDNIFRKYEIAGFSVDTSKSYASYLVRELYSEGTKDDINYIAPISASYLINRKTNETTINYDDYATISKKSVAYEVLAQDWTQSADDSYGILGPYLIQQYYALFKLSDGLASKIASMNKIELQYSYYQLCGYSDVSKAVPAAKNATEYYNDFKKDDLVKSITQGSQVNGGYFYHVSDESTVTQTVVPGTDTVTYTDWWDIFHMNSHNFDLSSIVDLSKADTSNYVSSADVKSYNYMVRFKQFPFVVSTCAYGAGGSFGNYFIGYDYSSFDDTVGLSRGVNADNIFNPYLDSYKLYAQTSLDLNASRLLKSPAQVENFTIARLWYTDYFGQEHAPIVVDSYKKSAGNIPVTNPVQTWLDKFIKWFLDNLPMSAVYCALALVCLVLLPTIVKVISIPFKLLGYLFGRPKK